MKEIIVYGRTSPFCQNCETAKASLDSLDIKFTYVDLGENPEIRTNLMEEGHRSIPVIKVGGELSSLAKVKEEALRDAD